MEDWEIKLAEYDESNLEEDLDNRNYTCKDCKYYNVSKPCYRIDHDKIEFVSIPHIICNDFEPIEWHRWDNKYWTDFDDYFERWQKWHTNRSKLVWITLKDDNNVKYAIDEMHFIADTMYYTSSKGLMLRSNFREIKGEDGYDKIKDVNLTTKKCNFIEHVPSEDRTKPPFEGFPNFTWEMYDGNAPAGKGHGVYGTDDFFDRWSCKYGGGETYKGRINHADFNINYKINIYICGDTLWITDIRYSDKSDVWEYSNKNDRTKRYNHHELEPEKIEKILNTKIDNCKFWDMVQARAKELYYDF
jgi:hypothetical protein